MASSASPDAVPPVIVICQLTAGERVLLARRRAQGSRQRRAWRRAQLGWGAGFLVGLAVLLLVLHSHGSVTVKAALGGTVGGALAGMAGVWTWMSRQRRARLRRWPAMTVTISRHGLTVQDARTANRLEWADIGPIHDHAHALEFHDHFGNLLAYLPPRLLTDDQRLQVMAQVHAAGRAITALAESSRDRGRITSVAMAGRTRRVAPRD